MDLLNSASILLAPSVVSKDGDQEGIPVGLMEAMAVGLPVVSTYHSGIPELVEDNVSGLLIPERDVDALVDKMIYLVEHPEIWAEMGRAGRSVVEDRYNSDHLNDQLVKLYKELVG